MPASRIAFAIGDLVAEIKRLLPRDAEVAAELRLSRPAYARVKAELGHHYGQQLVAYPLHGSGGEHFKIGALVIATMVETVEA